MSNRQELIEALVDRLEAIQVVGGYQTDAGLHVFTHETVELGPDDPNEAIAMVINDDDPRYQAMQIFTKVPIEIQALAKVTTSQQAYMRVEAILADIKRAIEQADRTVGKLVQSQLERGVTRTLPREPGSQTVGVGITYICPMTEVWGNP